MTSGSLRLINHSSRQLSLSVYAVLLLFTLFLLYTSGADGPLRSHYPHGDSSWFFMGGKAWMSGLTPYVDFTDSKGPFLWLLYGIGYLLHPTSFAGMFWIEVLFYWGTFTLIYKIARIFSLTSAQSLIAAFISAIFFFLPIVHGEMRTEDFNQLFSALAVYSIARILIEKGSLRRYGFYLGIVLALTLLMKFNFAMLAGVPVFIILIFSGCRYGWKGFFKFFLSVSLGAVCILLPFLLYFIHVGALEAFIREYFVNTFLTIKGTSHSTSLLKPLLWPENFLNLIVKFGPYQIIMKIICLCVVYMPLKIYKTNWFRWTIWIWLFVSLLMFMDVILDYYLNYFGIFGIFAGITLIYFFRKVNIEGATIVGLLSILLIVLLSQNVDYAEFQYPKNALARQESLDRIKRVLVQRSREKGAPATISFVRVMDRGEHISSGSLPGTKYWALQNGSTMAMRKANIEDVFKNRPDMVITDSRMTEYRKRLEGEGYTHLFDYHPYYLQNTKLIYNSVFLNNR